MLASVVEVDGLASVPSKWTPTMKGETLVNTVTEVLASGGRVSFPPQYLKQYAVLIYKSDY